MLTYAKPRPKANVFLQCLSRILASNSQSRALPINASMHFLSLLTIIEARKSRTLVFSH